MRETTSKGRFRRALLLMKPAHTGHHPGAVPGFRPSPGNSEETTTRVLTEEISVLFRVPTWDPTHPGSPVSRALPGNTPTQGPTREGKPGFFLGGGGNPGRNPGHGLGKTRERGGFRVFPVGTEKAIENAAATFTTESGMVKMPCDHSFIHFHHFIRAWCSTTYTFR